jgi:hypothetical protein
LDDPTVAIELFPDADEAAKQASDVENREYDDGETVHKFSLLADQ